MARLDYPITEKDRALVSEKISLLMREGKPQKQAVAIALSMWRHGYLTKNNPEYLKGGRADYMPDSFFDKKSLKSGIAIEMEHTRNKAIAKEIAKDHLAEDPKYYEKLKRVERKSNPTGNSLRERGLAKPARLRAGGAPRSLLKILKPCADETVRLAKKYKFSNKDFQKMVNQIFKVSDKLRKMGHC